MHLHLCANVRVLNSQHREINVALYKELCTSVYLKLISRFKWAVISPSLHRFLSHSWELIEVNENHGLGSGSEAGLEATNKLVKHLRIHGARKTSTKANFKDTFQHPWHRSSPLIVEINREKRRRMKRILVLGDINTLVESLFFECDILTESTQDQNK